MIISKERYRSLVDSSHDFIFDVGTDGQIEFANQTWFRELGYTESDLSSLKLNQLVNPDTLSFFKLMLRRVLRGENYFDVQILFLTKTGKVISMEGDMTPHKQDGHVVSAQCLFRNITKQKTAENALRTSNNRMQEMSRRLLFVQEEERRKLSRELHDEIGQRMTVLKMQLQSIRRKNEQEQLNPQMDDMLELLSTTLQDIRSMSMDLRPTLLDDMGLIATLRWYLDKNSQRTGIEMPFHTNIDHRLPADIEVVCFRVVQEALTNVMKYAEATEAVVSLFIEPKGTTLTIEDNGLGFDVEQVREKGARGSGLGLRGMEERVMLANGQLTVESKRGNGSKISVWIPNHSFRMG